MPSTILSLKHDNPNTASLLFVDVVPPVDSASDCRCTVVVQIEMQLTIPRSKLLWFEEKGVIKKGQSIEDIEIVLPKLSACKSQRREQRSEGTWSYSLRQDQGIVHELI